MPAKKLLLKLFYDVERIPKWNPTVFESKIIKKIDKYTDISYQVSAPGGAGLVSSRDFINLRCWKVIKNGNIFDDDLSDNTYSRLNEWRTRSHSIPSPTFNGHRLRKSTSATDMNEDIAEVRNKTWLRSLSRSVGAKVFADESIEQQINISSDSNDIFVDAKETQSIAATSAKSVTIPEQIDANSSENIYIMQSVGIKYDGMPKITKYTRLEFHIFTCVLH